MAKIIDLNAHSGRDIEAVSLPIVVKTLYIGRRRMTRSFFKQIPSIRLETWPQSPIGWIKTERPWLVFVNDGQLCRADVSDWMTENDDGTRSPATDDIIQLYLV